MRQWLRVLPLGVLSLFVTGLSWAHENEKVHPDLAVKSAALIFGTDQARYAEINLKRGVVGNRVGNDDIQEGAIVEDDGRFPEDVPLLMLRPMRHFYNPYTQAGLPFAESRGQGNALTNGTALWNQAVAAYKAGDRNRACFTLGRALHYIQDMTSPPHVHDDKHPPLFSFNGYEVWEEDNFVTLAAWVGNLIPPATDYGTFLVSVASRTNVDVRIAGHLQRSTATPATGDLATLFPPIAYMTYVSSDPGGIRERWHIVGVGSNFAGAGAPSEFGEDDWWRAEPRAAGEFYYLENIRNAIPAKVWNVTTSTYEANTSNLAIPALWAGIPSQPNLRATPTQTGLLVPRTIEAGAGLLRLFESSVTLRVVVSSPTETRPLTRVSGTQPVTVNFDRPVDTGTAILGQTVVVYSSVTPLAGTLSWNASRTTMTFVPLLGWPVDNFFTLEVKADDVMTTDVVEGVRGADGSVLTKRFLLHFKNVTQRFFVGEDNSPGNVYGYRADGTRFTTIGGIAFPWVLAYDDDTGFLYVTEFGAGGTNKIIKMKADGSERAVLPLTLGFEPSGLYFERTARTLYGSRGTNQFALFRTDENGSFLQTDVDLCPAVVGGVLVLFCTDEFNSPRGLRAAGNRLYVADFANNTVMQKDFGGAVAIVVVGQMKQFGSGVNQLNGPSDVDLDTSGKFVVADTFNNRVIRTGAGGAGWEVLPAPGGSYRPHNVWVNPATNDIFVVDSSGGRLVKISGTRVSVVDRGLNFPNAVDGGGTPDNASPVGGAVTTEQSTLVIRWTTTEPSDSLVRYSTSPLLEGATELLNATLVTEHTVMVAGLSSLTTYYYQIVTRDAARNALIYPVQSVVTQEVISGALPGGFLQNGATVVVTNASGRVGKAEFFLDGALQQTSSSTPFQWVVGPATDGVRALSVRVTQGTTMVAPVAGTYAVTGPTVTLVLLGLDGQWA